MPVAAVTAAEPGAAAGGTAGPGWSACLALGFARRDERTILARRSHRGPLVVQKALHPEGPQVCQAIVVHPPGGIAGGDRLAFELEIGAGAHAQLTTPGAAKWYRTSGPIAQQTFAARVGAGAVLEWLPQEAIVFDGAHAETSARVELDADAVFIGWDLVRLGRTASGERFERGALRQRFELVRDRALIWTERSVLDGADALVTSRAGLNACPMFGTFVVAAPLIADDLLADWRRVVPDDAAANDAAVTRLPGVLVARWRGRSAEAARRWFGALWSVARPALLGRTALPPRIWST